MACLFILCQDLIPHLHDFKNDVSFCRTKKELAARDMFQPETTERALGEELGNKMSHVPTSNCYWAILLGFARNRLH